MAVIHKVHREYSSNLLSARSLIHQCRVLCQPPPVDTHVKKLRSKYTKLGSARPERITGRHVFLAGCYAAVKDAQQLQRIDETTRLSITKRHGELWGNLPLAKRKEYDLRGIAMADKKRGAVTGDVQHAASAMKLHTSRANEEKHRAGALQCLLSNARFSDKAFQDMSDMFFALAFSIAQVLRDREVFFAAPQSPPAHELAALVALALPAFRDARGETPSWVKELCRRREHLGRCGLCGAIDGRARTCAIVFIVKSPYLVALCPLDRKETTMPASGSLGASEQKRVLQNVPWKCFAMRREWLADVGVAFDDENLGIVFDLEYKPGFEANFHSDPWPSSAPRLSNGRGRRRSRRRSGRRSRSPSTTTSCWPSSLGWRITRQQLWRRSPAASEVVRMAVSDLRQSSWRMARSWSLGARSTSGDRSGLWRRRRHHLALRQSSVAAHGRRPTSAWHTIASPLAHHRSPSWSS